MHTQNVQASLLAAWRRFCLLFPVFGDKRLTILSLSFLFYLPLFPVSFFAVEPTARLSRAYALDSLLSSLHLLCSPSSISPSLALLMSLLPTFIYFYFFWTPNSFPPYLFTHPSCSPLSLPLFYLPAILSLCSWEICNKKVCVCMQYREASDKIARTGNPGKATCMHFYFFRCSSVAKWMKIGFVIIDIWFYSHLFQKVFLYKLLVTSSIKWGEWYLLCSYGFAQ